MSHAFYRTLSPKDKLEMILILEKFVIYKEKII